jgi:CelD/BcsL family acetyltransferase involved in cellulose biosynthesis
VTCPTLTVSQAASFDALAREWSDLLARCSGNTIFLTPDWQQTWWRYAGEGELALIAVRAGEELVGVAPMIHTGNDWGFAGGAEVADFLDVIAAEGHGADVADAVLDFLTPRGGRVELRNLRPDAVGATIIPELARRRGLAPVLEREDVSPKVDLPEDWDSYLQSLTKKDRHELRRKLRRLMSAGDVRYYVANDAATRSADVDDFLRLHRHSADEKAAFMNQRMEQFFRGLVDEFSPRGWLRLYFLEIDGTRVASVILFDYGGEFLLYNSGYDPAYSHLSVGLLLKAFCLRDAIDERRKVFDFLQGNEPYKYDLGALEVPILRLQLDLGAHDGVIGGNHRV